MKNQPDFSGKSNLMYLLPTLLLSFLFVPSFSQTAGSGTLSTIESKANSIEQNDTRVAELNRQHLGSYSLESDKLAQLKRALSNLITEKTTVLDEYRRGQFCTGCNVPRSQFRPGESFPHPGQSVRAATPQELAAKEKEYDDKISRKQEELKQFEFGENEFTRKRADLDKQMNDLKSKSDKLREEIVELSKRYKELVVQDGKSMQSNYIAELMRIVAEKHYIEDRLNIILVKLSDLENEESKAVSEARDKAARKADTEKENHRKAIEVNKARLENLKIALQARIDPMKSSLADARKRLFEVNQLLQNTARLSSDEVTKYQVEKNGLEARIASLEKAINQLDTDYETNRRELEAKNKELADKIWDLTVNLPKFQQQAVDAVKSAFSMKRKILTDAKVARTASLDQTGSLLITKKEAARQKFVAYSDKVDQERVRLLRACQKAGCSCYGIDTHGTVVGNWNRALGCVGEMEGAHNSGDPVYGCVEESATYKQHYSSLLNGLSDSDREALQRQSGKTRYDLIFRKITN